LSSEKIKRVFDRAMEHGGTRKTVLQERLILLLFLPLRKVKRKTDEHPAMNGQYSTSN